IGSARLHTVRARRGAVGSRQGSTARDRAGADGPRHLRGVAPGDAEAPGEGRRLAEHASRVDAGRAALRSLDMFGTKFSIAARLALTVLVVAAPGCRGPARPDPSIVGGVTRIDAE